MSVSLLLLLLLSWTITSIIVIVIVMIMLLSLVLNSRSTGLHQALHRQGHEAHLLRGDGRRRTKHALACLLAP